jgi:hypothetical protein
VKKRGDSLRNFFLFLSILGAGAHFCWAQGSPQNPTLAGIEKRFDAEDNEITCYSYGINGQMCTDDHVFIYTIKGLVGKNITFKHIGK